MLIVELSTPPEVIAEYPNDGFGENVKVPVGRWLHFWHGGGAPETDEGNHEVVFFKNGEWCYEGKIYTDMVIYEEGEFDGR